MRKNTDILEDKSVIEIKRTTKHVIDLPALYFPGIKEIAIIFTVKLFVINSA